MTIKSPEVQKEAVPEVSWEEFQQRFYHDWAAGGEGQHVSAIGRTRSGTTTTIHGILPGTLVF